MRSFLLNTKTKQKIEILDQVVFEVGTTIMLPEWSNKPFYVSDIAYSADMQGAQCSLTEQIFVRQDDEEEKSTINAN